MLHNLIDFKRRSKREEKNKIDLLSWTPIKFAHWLIEYVRYNCKSWLVRSLSLYWTATNCNLVQAALSLHFSFYQCSAPTDLISDIFHWWLMTDFNGLIDLDLIKRLKLIWEIEQNAQSDASEQLLWKVFEKFLKSIWKIQIYAAVSNWRRSIRWQDYNWGGNCFEQFLSRKKQWVAIRAAPPRSWIGVIGDNFSEQNFTFT